MDFWTEYGPSLSDLAVYAAGIAVYTIVVTLLYKPLSSRLMFAKRLGDRAVATTGRRFLYVLLFPLVSFGFFLVVASALFFLSSFEIGAEVEGEAGLSPQSILTIAMATVLAIRICAYFHEDGAEELAKVMPLGLLGVVLVTNRVEGLGESLENMLQFFDHLPLILVFFMVVVLVEFLLRGVYELAGRPKHKPPVRPQPPPTFNKVR